VINRGYKNQTASDSRKEDQAEGDILPKGKGGEPGRSKNVQKRFGLPIPLLTGDFERDLGKIWKGLRKLWAPRFKNTYRGGASGRRARLSKRGARINGERVNTCVYVELIRLSITTGDTEGNELPRRP